MNKFKQIIIFSFLIFDGLLSIYLLNKTNKIQHNNVINKNLRDITIRQYDLRIRNYLYKYYPMLHEVTSNKKGEMIHISSSYTLDQNWSVWLDPVRGDIWKRENDPPQIDSSFAHMGDICVVNLKKGEIPFKDYTYAISHFSKIRLQKEFNLSLPSQWDSKSLFERIRWVELHNSNWINTYNEAMKEVVVDSIVNYGKWRNYFYNKFK